MTIPYYIKYLGIVVRWFMMGVLGSRKGWELLLYNIRIGSLTLPHLTQVG